MTKEKELLSQALEKIDEEEVLSPMSERSTLGLNEARMAALEEVRGE